MYLRIANSSKMAICPDTARPGHYWDITQNRLHQTRRRKYFSPRNHGLLSAFAVCCCFLFMMTFLETSRVLIPSKVVSKRDLHMLTEGFTNDLQSKGEGLMEDPFLSPRPHRPGAVVVGFSHCGAYVIMSALSVHPHIAVNKKNVNFFSGNQSTEWYISQMPLSLGHHVTVDLSVSSIHDKSALKKLKAFNETVRVIVVLCDPISRLISKHADDLKRQTAHPRTQGFGDVPLAKSLTGRVFPVQNNTTPTLRADLLSGVGDYFKHFIDLFQAFPRRQVHVVEQRRFYDNPRTELAKLHKFLRVVPLVRPTDILYDRIDNSLCYNSFAWRRLCVRGVMKNASDLFLPKYGDHLTRLRKFFAPYNKRLFIYLEDVYAWL